MYDKRSKIIKDSTHYFISNVIGQGAGLIKIIAIPIIFGPAQLGIWSLMNVLMGYGANSHFGLLHGMNKMLPLLRGQNRYKKCEDVKNSIFWINLFLGVLVACGLGITSFFIPNRYVLSLRVIALGVFFQQIYVYIFCLLRAEKEFSLVSKGLAGFSIISTIFIVLFALCSSNRLLGALVGLVCAFLVVTLYWFVKKKFKFIFFVDWKIIRENFSLGVPLILIGFFDMIFLSIDRWMITAHLEEVSLGYYAIGFMLTNMIGLFTVAAVQVLYPHMLERFSSVKDLMVMKRLLIVPIRILSSLMLMLLSVMIIIFPVLIQLFLPKYIPSIPIIHILLPGAFFLTIANVSGTFLIAVNKQNWLMIVQFIAFIFSLILDSVLLWAGYGVVGVAIGTVIGYCIYGLGYTVMAIYMVLKKKIACANFIFKLIMPFITMVVLFSLVNYFIHEEINRESYLFLAALKSMIIIMGLLISLWFSNRDIKIISLIRKEIKLLRSC